MTGIERLHKLIADIDVNADPKLWDILRRGTEGGWDCDERDDKTLCSTLAAIADQIKRERLKAHALGLERKCAERGETIRELSDRAAKQSDEIRVMRDVIVETCARLGVEGTGSTVDDAQVIWREISRRLMPDGLEWPRYESGEPVPIGGEFMGKDGKTYTAKQIQFIGKCFSLFDFCDEKPQFGGFYGERVKRPAPKVLDADGVEIRVGDRVWSTHLDEPHEWIVIDPHEDRGDSQTVLVSIGDRTGHARPEDLTHRAPVLAADGRPLRVGETVWLTDGRERHVVLSTEEDGIGSIVTEVQAPGAVKVHISPSRLTHERPDSWERLEEDAMLSPHSYICACGKHDDAMPKSVQMSIDLVRRAKALAERERGE